MSMLLTIPPPVNSDFGGKSTHEFSPRFSLSKIRASPQQRRNSPVSSLRISRTIGDERNDTGEMSTPHRGLPPPSAMTLPDPGRGHTSLPLPHQFNGMPQPPNQWQGQEESMRNWLVAKAEEDKRKQEEEKTNQERLKLKQREVEQSILRESLQGGVPPALVPLIYAGLGRSHLANVSADWLQEYVAQLQAAQQQALHPTSPEMRRESRMIGPGAAAFGASQPLHSQQPHQILPSQAIEQAHQQVAPLQTTFSAYQPSPSRPAPTSAPRSATHTSLPRLTTNEMHVQQPPQQPNTGSAHPLQQSQTVQQSEQTSSPSIYFHHWVPPSDNKPSNPQTPAAGKGEPHSAHPGSHLSEGDYKESPRKRKAQGAHQAAPPPTDRPQYTSPSFSNASSTGKRAHHNRSRSNASARESEGRPDSRRDFEPPKAPSQHDSFHINDDRHRSHESPYLQDERARRSSADMQREWRMERPPG